MSDKKTNSTENKVNHKPKKKTSILLAVLIALFVAMIAAVAILLLYKPNYGVDLPFTTDATADSTVTFVSTDESGNTTVIEYHEIERKQERVNFLIIGKDRWAFNTDVMMIVSYDVSNGAISIMQIPRDTYIDLGRGTNRKANSLLASFYGEASRDKNEKDPYATALTRFEEALEKTFCITIDYYAMMDLNGFVNIVDALGGVEMDVPSRMYYTDPIQKLYINLYPGKQTLTGAQAEQFVRFRSGYVEGDMGRVDAQKLFMSAFVESVKKNFSVSTIASVVEQAMKYVTTDISLQDMIYYAKSAMSVDLSKMTMMTIPSIQCRQYQDAGGWYVVVYKDAAIEAFNKYFNSYNFEITADMFDTNGVLYDETGSYMYSIYTKKNVEEESYTADHTDDIYIYRYGNTTPVSTTAATTKVVSAETTKAVTKATTKTAEKTSLTAETAVHTEEATQSFAIETSEVTVPEITETPVQDTEAAAEGQTTESAGAETTEAAATEATEAETTEEKTTEAGTIETEAAETSTEETIETSVETVQETSAEE